MSMTAAHASATTATVSRPALPAIVSRAEWQVARDRLLEKENAAMQVRDAINAERRRLPMVEIDREYRFQGADGMVSLLDLFDGRHQLIVQHFMFDPAWDEGCPGCSSETDNIGHLAHLHARDTSLVLISRAPFAKLAAYRERMGWTVPWFSSFETSFNEDFGATSDDGEIPGVSVFLTDGERVFQTYYTTDRGVEPLSGLTGYLDLTPYGRQEEWEDSPEGWPQTPPFEWLRRHDRYGS